MKLAVLSFILSLSLHSVSGAVIVSRNPANDSEISGAQLLEISPTLASCPEYAKECRTADEAAPVITRAFALYNITALGERAAILANMLFESRFFLDDKSSVDEGAGTRNMMPWVHILAYALDLPATRQAALALYGNAMDISTEAIYMQGDQAGFKTKSAVRKLVIDNDELSFASAMWQYRFGGPKGTGCDAIKGLAGSGTKEGWDEYIEKCLYLSPSDKRTEVWNKTQSVLTL
ncbi:hypothetical protein HGRIS_001164 [Hohenbuehelia grisea]|uniref:Uncharacterized protein n=1 Tax=Hohenbuehelia grisea TaxID=104357 RepID=A0ABR3JPH9_9AGAR